MISRARPPELTYQELYDIVPEYPATVRMLGWVDEHGELKGEQEHLTRHAGEIYNRTIYDNAPSQYYRLFLGPSEHDWVTRLWSPDIRFQSLYDNEVAELFPEWALEDIL